MYAADNGLAIGSHGLLGKQNLYEHSMKVPLIISGPGIPEGRVSGALVYLYDLFPTLSSLCVLPQTDGVDGKDITPVIKGSAEAVRNSLFTVYRNTVRAVRTDEWKLIRYPQRDYNQLFNLKQDPLELNNLAYKPENQPKVKELLGSLIKWQAETGDTAVLTSKTILPMEYDPSVYKQKPDQWQPEYTLKRYFSKPDVSVRVN